jgi:hypothetical protein
MSRPSIYAFGARWGAELATESRDEPVLGGRGVELFRNEPPRSTLTLTGSWDADDPECLTVLNAANDAMLDDSLVPVTVCNETAWAATAFVHGIDRRDEVKEIDVPIEHKWWDSMGRLYRWTELVKRAQHTVHVLVELGLMQTPRFYCL